MATEWISPTWRMPNDKNQSKFENYSLDFNGGTEAIDIGVSSFVQNDPYSLSFWIKRNESNAFGGTILALGNGTSVNNIILWWKNNTTLTISNGQGTNYYRDLPSTTYNIGQWYHFAIVGTIGTYSPVDLEVYLDGVPITLITTLSAISANQTSSAIGKLPNNAGYNLTGVMSDLSIFDYKLSTDQINYLYNSGTPQNPMAISGQPPVAYYPLGGSSTGSSSTLTIPNESVADATVFDFDGSTDYIQVDNFESTNNTDTCSYSAWVNIDSSATGVRGIFGKGKSGANFEFNVRYYTAGTNLFIIQIDGTTVFENSSLSISTDAWHHIAVVIDRSLSAGSNIKLFVDGVEIANSASVSFAQFTSTGYPLYIGAEADTSTSPRFEWYGEISNVQVWNTSLSSAEVTTLYNNGVPLLTGTQPEEANLKAWYPMNVDNATWNGSNWIIEDSSTPYSGTINFQI